MKYFCKYGLILGLLFSVNLLSAQNCGTTATTVANETKAKVACQPAPDCQPSDCVEMVENGHCTPAEAAKCLGAMATTETAAAQPAQCASATAAAATPSCQAKASTTRLFTLPALEPKAKLVSQ